jgi:hypothetical protein
VKGGGFGGSVTMRMLLWGWQECGMCSWKDIPRDARVRGGGSEVLGTGILGYGKLRVDGRRAALGGDYWESDEGY